MIIKNSNHFFSLNTILGFALRMASILPKFILLFYISRELPLDDLGTFGIFSSGIVILSFVVGLNFYSFSVREVVKSSSKVDQKRIILSQFIFHFLFYPIILVIIGLFFIPDSIAHFTFYFFVILIFEHLTQEIYRILIGLSYVVWANLIYFIKAGLWIVALLALQYFFKSSSFVSLNTIFLYWTVGVISCFMVGVCFIVYHFGLFSFKDLISDWKWFKNGVIVSSVFFLVEIISKITEYAGRYIIDYLYDRETTGVFVFFSQITNMINVIVDASAIAFLYPILIVSFNSQNLDAFALATKKMVVRIVVMSLIGGTALAIVFTNKTMLSFLGKEQFAENQFMLMLLILNSILFNISLVFHFLLYATQRDDKPLFISAFVGFGVTLFAMYVCANIFGYNGIAIGSIIGTLSTLIVRATYCKKSTSLEPYLKRIYRNE